MCFVSHMLEFRSLSESRKIQFHCCCCWPRSFYLFFSSIGINVKGGIFCVASFQAWHALIVLFCACEGSGRVSISSNNDTSELRCSFDSQLKSKLFRFLASAKKANKKKKKKKPNVSSTQQTFLHQMLCNYFSCTRRRSQLINGWTKEAVMENMCSFWSIMLLLQLKDCVLLYRTKCARARDVNELPATR